MLLPSQKLKGKTPVYLEVLLDFLWPRPTSVNKAALPSVELCKNIKYTWSIVLRLPRSGHIYHDNGEKIDTAHTYAVWSLVVVGIFVLPSWLDPGGDLTADDPLF